jgi:hypothetical protein
MFVETTDISAVIVNIDGLISFDQVRNVTPQFLIRKQDNPSKMSIEPDIGEVLNYLNKQYTLYIVTSQTEEKVREVLKSLGNSFHPAIFSAMNSTEQILLLQPIKRAVASSRFKPCNFIYLCGDKITISQAQSLRLGTIFWEPKNIDEGDKEQVLKDGPDFQVTTKEEILNIFTRKLLGYYGEVLASPPDLTGTFTKGQYLKSLSFPNREFPDSTIEVSGRYFKKADPRHTKHALSLRIVNSKNNMDRHKNLFARIVGVMILNSIGNDFDFITRIPPKPSQRDDRIKDVIEALGVVKLSKGKIDLQCIKPELVKCMVDYPSQKDAGGYDARRENVRGVFSLTSSVRDKKIIVVDDVTTSGATLMETTELMTNAGAKQVKLFALAYHPENLTEAPAILICPQCGREMSPRLRKNDGQPFYGCQGFFERPSCKNSMSFGQAVRQLNEANQIDMDLEPFDDIEF